MNPIAPRHSGERTIARIPIDRIRANSHQPRQIFQDATIADLAESIRQHGLLSPLLVRRVGPGQFELIAGERRLRALKLLGCDHAEAIVATAYDQDSALMALVENLQRENLHYLDESEAYRAILDSQPLSQEHLARTLGLSPSALANRLRLLKLAEDVRKAVREKGLSERHARALLKLDDPACQLALINECAQHGLTVKQFENRIAHILHSGPSPRRPAPMIRDNRIIINAVLDTVKELNRIGVHVESRVEERDGGVEVIVRIPGK